MGKTYAYINSIEYIYYLEITSKVILLTNESLEITSVKNGSHNSSIHKHYQFFNNLFRYTIVPSLVTLV